jgi:hypothetical protein
VRIDRPGCEPGGHVSNTELADYDFDKVIANATTVEEFEAAVLEYASGLLTDGVPVKMDFTADLT